MKSVIIWACIVVGLLIGFGAGSLGRPVEGVQAQSGQPGRYQIINGTPAMAQNIMLLDTATGQSWITCNNEKGGTGWCLLFRTNVSSSSKQ